MKVRMSLLVAVLLFSVFPGSVAQAATCTPTGFFRDGINMTAALINPGNVTGEVDATGCNVGVYYNTGSATVSAANIHGANYFGVLVNGDVNNVTVNVQASFVHDIGETPFNGTQHGVAIYYRALGTGTVAGKVWNNTISSYQKGGIVANGAGANVSVRDNVVTGLGPVSFIAQNGIQIGFGGTGLVENNTVSGNSYTGANFASSGGILVVGGPCYGLPDYTRGVQIVGNTVVNNDVGVWLSNIQADCVSAPTTATNNRVVSNTISDNAVTNTTGGGAVPYQAGIADQGNNDKLINNDISGVGYAGCAPGTCVAVDADASFTNRARVHANSVS